MQEQKCQIIKNINIAKNIYLMELKLKENEKSNAGQFIQILCRQPEQVDPYLRRPFSIFFQEKEKLQIVYKVIGKGTKYLSNLQKDSYVSIIYPLGNGFSIQEKDKKVLIISGGIGIAGLNYLIKILEQKNIYYKLLAGFESKESMPEFVNNYKFEKRIIFNEEGFVTDLLEREELKKYDKAYICGPMLMIKNTIKKIEDKINDIEVSLEERMGCGIGICYTCPVKKKNEDGYYRVCKDGPVFKYSLIEIN